jgi:hypothetical protein
MTHIFAEVSAEKRREREALIPEARTASSRLLKKSLAKRSGS